VRSACVGTVPDRNQTFTGRGESDQKRVRREARVFRITGLRHLGRRRGLCQRRSQQHGQRQHAAPEAAPRGNRAGARRRGLHATLYRIPIRSSTLGW
jgi:hypothetical protein